MVEKDGKFHYFTVVLEALYPDSSYYEPQMEMFEDKAAALDFAKEICEDETRLMFKRTHVDMLQPERYSEDGEDGYVVTAKDGLSEWCIYARVIELTTRI